MDWEAWELALPSDQWCDCRSGRALLSCEASLNTLGPLSVDICSDGLRWVARPGLSGQPGCELERNEVLIRQSQVTPGRTGRRHVASRLHCSICIAGYQVKSRLDDVQVKTLQDRIILSASRFLSIYSQCTSSHENFYLNPNLAQMIFKPEQNVMPEPSPPPFSAATGAARNTRILHGKSALLPNRNKFR